MSKNYYWKTLGEKKTQADLIIGETTRIRKKNEKSKNGKQQLHDYGTELGKNKTQTPEKKKTTRKRRRQREKKEQDNSERIVCMNFKWQNADRESPESKIIK